MNPIDIENVTVTVKDGEGNEMTLHGVGPLAHERQDPVTRQQRRASERAEAKAQSRSPRTPMHPEGRRWARRQHRKARLRGPGGTR